MRSVPIRQSLGSDFMRTFSDLHPAPLRMDPKCLRIYPARLRCTYGVLSGTNLPIRYGPWAKTLPKGSKRSPIRTQKAAKMPASKKPGFANLLIMLNLSLVPQKWENLWARPGSQLPTSLYHRKTAIRSKHNSLPRPLTAPNRVCKYFPACGNICQRWSAAFCVPAPVSEFGNPGCNPFSKLYTSVREKPYAQS